MTTPPVMPHAVFVSPHLDDAVFSAGGTMVGLVADGWRVSLVTVFTRSVPSPTGFALRCQTDKGLSPDADYMALRRSEDAAAAAALGLDPRRDVHWLDMPEAPHRGYGSPAELCAPVRPDDEATTAAVADRLGGHVAGADVVFAPLGLGDHVDHVHVVRAVAAVCPASVPVMRWYDAPYVLRVARRPPPDGLADVGDVFDRKLRACAAYASQVGFQFGGEAALRAALSAEARRAGASRPGEPITVAAEPFVADARNGVPRGGAFTRFRPT